MSRTKLISILIFLALVFVQTSGQTQNLAPETRRTTKLTNMLNGLPFAKAAPGIEGNPYFNKHWDKVSVLINDQEEPLDDLYGRYGIFSDEVELITAQGVRAVPSSRIKEMVFTDSLLQFPTKFINIKTYDFDETHLVGLFQVLSEGKMMLLKGYKITILEPDFNIALNTGSKNIRILKESDIYCTHNNDLIRDQKSVV